MEIQITNENLTDFLRNLEALKTDGWKLQKDNINSTDGLPRPVYGQPELFGVYWAFLKKGS